MVRAVVRDESSARPGQSLWLHTPQHQNHGRGLQRPHVQDVCCEAEWSPTVLPHPMSLSICKWCVRPSIDDAFGTGTC